MKNNISEINIDELDIKQLCEILSEYMTSNFDNEFLTGMLRLYDSDYPELHNSPIDIMTKVLSFGNIQLDSFASSDKELAETALHCYSYILRSNKESKPAYSCPMFKFRYSERLPKLLKHIQQQAQYHETNT